MGDIKKQSIQNTFLSYLGAGLGFLIIYIQPHLISSSEIGLLRLLYSFSWMAAIIMPLGISTVTMRFFPKIRNDATTHHGYFLLITIIASAGALLIGMILYLNGSAVSSYYENSPEFPRYFEEAIVFAYILSLITVYTVYSSSLFKTTFTVFLTDVFTRCGQLLLVFIYSKGLLNQHQLVIGYISVFFVQLVLLFLYLVRHKAVSFRINWRFYSGLPLSQMLIFGIVMMFTAFASLGIKFIDQLMLGHFLNESLVGVYATSVMMCAVMEIPFNSLDRIASPKIAQAWNLNNSREVSKIYEMSSRYMYFVGGLLFCVLWATLDLIFHFLPHEYQIGKTAFYIVSVSSLVNLMTGVNSSVILFSSRYFAASLFLFVLIAVAFFANNWLIPSLGIDGAALGTLIAISTFNILKYLYILLKFGMQPFTKHTAYISIAVLLSIGMIFILPASLNYIIRSIIGVTFTVLVFSAMNIRYGMIEEVNKVFRRYGLSK